MQHRPLPFPAPLSSPAPAANPYVKKIDYNYDDDGNRASVVTKLWGLPAGTASYTTNNLNQYTNVATVARTHDANGNLTNDGTWKFVFNYKNLLVQVRDPSTNTLYATYKYDAEGRRVEKSVSGAGGGGGIFQRFIRSGGRNEKKHYCIEENPGKGARYDMSQVIAIYDASGAWKQNFVWGGTIDQIIALEQADILDYDSDGNVAEITRSFYHRNALGSVMEITDANQAVVSSYRYTPYGQMTITRGGVTQTTDPLGQFWGYTGRFSDEETELWYYRARYYDPVRGRFISRDPAGYSEGPGLYEYVDSSPINQIDSCGMGPREDDVETLAIEGAAPIAGTGVIAAFMASASIPKSEAPSGASGSVAFSASLKTLCLPGGASLEAKCSGGGSFDFAKTMFELAGLTNSITLTMPLSDGVTSSIGVSSGPGGESVSGSIQGPIGDAGTFMATFSAAMDGLSTFCLQFGFSF